MSAKTRNNTGKIFFTKKRGSRGKGHYMETENLAYCGRYIEPGRAMPDGWDPEDHTEVMCSTCLEWYRILHKRPQ
jgi:hypothetical protein